jgi:hypothetical protein
VDAAEPYLNLHLRQPIHLRRDGRRRFEALLDVRNLLAQGYRPYLLSDGSLLIFAQEQRGLASAPAWPSLLEPRASIPHFEPAPRCAIFFKWQ